MSASQIAEARAGLSQIGEWRRFFSILLLVLSPALAAAAALEALAWRIGETMPMSAISQWQDAAPDRLWRGGDGHSYATYKAARVRDLKPEIVALGPGRANAFRGDAVAPYTFYNAGLTAWTFDQYRRFLELIARDGYAPRVLVFNMDYWMFASGFDHYWVDRFDEHPTTHVADLLRVAAQVGDDPLSVWRLLPATEHLHGLYGLLAGTGFRADGSLPEAPATPDPQRLLADGTEAGVPPVEVTDRMAPEQVAKFDRFAAFAKERNISLIGVQLPLYEKILNGLDGNPQAGIWREFKSPEWQRHVAEAGVAFFDFSDMPEYRDKPQYFIDSLDPDARAVGAAMRIVMADPRVRAMLTAKAAAR